MLNLEVRMTANTFLPKRIKILLLFDPLFFFWHNNQFFKGFVKTCQLRHARRYPVVVESLLQRVHLRQDRVRRLRLLPTHHVPALPGGCRVVTKGRSPEKSSCSFGFCPIEGGGGPCPNFLSTFHKLYILGQFGDEEGGGDPCSNFLAHWH